MKKVLGLFIFLYVLLINTVLGYSLTVNGFYIEGIEEGQTVTVTAPKKMGYDFERWEVYSGNLTLSSPTSNPMDFSMSNGDSYIYSTYIETSINTSLYGTNIGDINIDNKITIADVNMLIDYLEGTVNLTQEQLSRADVNSDGEIDKFDARLILALVMRDINEWPVNIRCGDVTLDGTINSADSMQLKRFLEGKCELSQKQLLVADVNLDGSVDEFDAKLILAYFIGNIDKLPTNLICGDINEDGIINATDELFIRQYVANKRTLIEHQQLCADVNMDGKIDKNDISLIFAIRAGNIKKLPIDFLHGDLDRSGVVTSEDALLVLDYLDRVASLTEKQLVIADVNLDGVVDNTDAQAIHEYYLKNISSLPIMPMYGDIDGNGEVGSNDVTMLTAYINENIELSRIQQLIADVNLDNNVDETDLNLLQQYVLGRISELPVIGVSSIAEGSYVSYDSGHSDYGDGWVVLRDTPLGLEIISKESVGNLTLSGANGYASAVAKLNNKAKEYINPYYAVKGRSVGATDDSIEVINTSTYPLTYAAARNRELPYYDEYYTDDQTLIANNANLKHSIGHVWLASRILIAESDYSAFAGRFLMSSGDKNNDWLFMANSGGGTDTYSFSYGVRPVITLRGDIQIIGGSGTQADPYILGIPHKSIPVGTYVSYSGGNYAGKWVVLKDTNLGVEIISKESVGQLPIAGPTGFANLVRLLNDK